MNSITTTERILHLLKLHIHQRSIPMSSDGKPRSKCERLSLTCDVCRSRHQKCNGARPLCHNCQLRGLSCRYPEVPDGEQSDSRQKRVALDQKSYASLNAQSKHRTIGTENDHEEHSSVQTLLASELVRYSL